jgi:hypothetical protein
MRLLPSAVEREQGHRDRKDGAYISFCMRSLKRGVWHS